MQNALELFASQLFDLGQFYPNLDATNDDYSDVQPSIIENCEMVGCNQLNHGFCPMPVTVKNNTFSMTRSVGGQNFVYNGPFVNTNSPFWVYWFRNYL